MWGASVAVKRFRESMNIGYEQWHDGTGYDLEALDGMSDDEKRDVEMALIPRATSDWRDLEALERLGTPRAYEAIRDARISGIPEIRLHAHDYGPPPTEEEWDIVILDGLNSIQSFEGGLIKALNAAVNHPSPAVRAALWRIVRTPAAQGPYHAAEALCRIAGLIEEWDMTYRDLFLRLVGPASQDRDAAIRELEQLTGAP